MAFPPEVVTYRVLPAPQQTNNVDDLIVATHGLHLATYDHGWGAPTTPWIPLPPSTKLSLVYLPTGTGHPRSMGDFWIEVAHPTFPLEVAMKEVVREDDVIWDVVRVRILQYAVHV